jgi:imidazolonepropionase-like amidohydrolase
MVARALLLLCAAVPAHAGDVLALRVGKLITVADDDAVYAPGMLLCEDGKLTYVGAPIEVPEGAAVIELADSWCAPGLVDLHTHIHGPGINDMVHAVNPELRARPCVIPGNAAIRLGCAGGVTTLFGIPGSGTNMGGFGVLYKARVQEPTYEAIVLRDPGGLKVAQDSNPQRRNATDFGVTRAGQSWNLRDVALRARAAWEQDRVDYALEALGQVMSGDLPVLIHTAGSDGVVNTARMWKVDFQTRCTVSHGSFDGWKTASALAAMDCPVNHGPRTVDFYSSQNGRINGSAAEFVAAGVPHFSLNTDSGVVPQEEFFLQAAMSARYGADSYTMLRALTANPAKAFGIDSRVGSLEVGKDADVVVWTGDPLDPRACVRLVLIEGDIEYDRERDGQLF